MMVLLQTFNSRVEAEIARALLQAHGVHAMVQADDQGGLRPALALSFGVNLRVSVSDQERARQILGDALKANKLQPVDPEDS